MFRIFLLFFESKLHTMIKASAIPVSKESLKYSLHCLIAGLSIFVSCGKAYPKTENLSV